MRLGIKRTYVYAGFTEMFKDKTPFSGVISHRSWFPNPEYVHALTKELASLKSGCGAETKYMTITYFARVK